MALDILLLLSSFNRTAYGIETGVFPDFIECCGPFNRTAYGIETELLRK